MLLVESQGGALFIRCLCTNNFEFFFICRLALGARAVLIGRPYVWGLAHSGEEGVKHVLQLLRDEFIMALQLCGCTKLSDIEPEHVMHHQRYLAKL